MKNIEEMGIVEILDYAIAKQHELVEKEHDDAFDSGYDSGFEDGEASGFEQATQIILDWIKDNHAKMLYGLKEGLEYTGVAGDIRALTNRR